MKTFSASTLLSSLCLLLVNPAHAQATAAPAPAANASSAMGPTAKGTAALSATDVTFMKRAAEGGHLEVEGSTLAGTKAASEAVKGFAKQMVADHTKAGDELKQLASGKNVTLPDRPSPAQRAKLKLLSASSGASFDKKYADSIGVDAHTDTVKLFQAAAKNSKDADVKAFAVKTLLTLQHHLEMATQLKATVDQTPKSKSGS